ncbi:HNH endonuclease [Gimesia aquarii]|uniref:HNH domain-containing protein n=1 Tax=Gimesia aquarii TaxID=2527964 RepID=A0A517VQM4_9PLAN|nr:HNH endonuclease [Gimesia aquarii]QDT95240.1 hypothetical protein V144x_06810 [Gimesia aquarii]
MNNLPFDSYPNNGRNLLGKKSTENCRHGYGLKLQKLTGISNCGYCGISLTINYEQWLLMQVDHVLPTNMGNRLRISSEWLDDYSNCLLACSACNTFDPLFDEKSITESPSSLQGFYDLRDRVYLIRKRKILKCQKVEREFYDSKPWE